MKPVPIPENVPGRRIIIGEPGMNPADPAAPTPCEYLIGKSSLYPGRPTFSVRLMLDASEVQAIQSGSRHVWLTLDGAEVPWSVEVEPAETFTSYEHCYHYRARRDPDHKIEFAEPCCRCGLTASQVDSDECFRETEGERTKCF